MELGTQIKVLRLQRRATQEALADALGEAVSLLAQQWDITSGEEVDRLRREIARLSQ